MSMLFYIFFSIFVLLILILCVRDMKKPISFPPGPTWMPFIGSLIYIKRLHTTFGYFHLVWNYLSKQYGEIVGLRIGKDRLIVVSGKEAIKEFYGIDEFNGRPNGFFFCIRYFNKRLGIVFRDGKSWEIQRKFSIKLLRELGVGRQCMIEHIERESANMIEYLLDKLSDNKHHNANIEFNSIHIGNIIDAVMGNIMWAILAGQRFNLDDEKLLNFLHFNHESFRVVDMSGGLLNQFPFIRHFAPGWSKYTKLLEVHQPMHNFIFETIKKIKKNLYASVPNCFIALYLIEIERRLHLSNQNEPNTFTELQLVAVCLDIIQAGVETTSNTLTFGIIYMLHNVEIQKKIRKEIDRIVGSHRLPNLNDRLQLTYTEATIYEIIRMSNVAPLGIIHRCMQTTTFRGYVIPEGTLAMVSLHSLNMDTKYWGDPMEFRPERFLDSNGKLLQHDQFIPFGMGKRRCMGENLAKSSLFLIFASLMHMFDLGIPIGNDLPDRNGYDGITVSPKPFKIILTKRL